jgi:hypothetical protein
MFDPSQVDAARREIAKTRLDFVRYRGLEVCIGLQPLQLDALQLCEILQHWCGPDLWRACSHFNSGGRLQQR